MIPRRRGMTLLEVVIALALIALGIVFVLGILPTSVLSVKRSEDMEAATAYGVEVVEDARRQLPETLSQTFVKTLNQTEFTVTRDIYVVDQATSDIVVVASWSPDRPGIRLATRVRGLPPSPSPSPAP